MMGFANADLFTFKGDFYNEEQSKSISLEFFTCGP